MAVKGLSLSGATAPNWEIHLGEAVQVDWDDAFEFPGEIHDVFGLPDACLKQTVGFLVRATDRSLFLAHEREPVSGVAYEVTRVPRGMVLAFQCLSRAPVNFDTGYTHTAT